MTRRAAAPPKRDEALTVAELAAELKLSPNTLYWWRHMGRGPKAFKAEGSVRYRRSDVTLWLAASGDSAATARGV